MNKRPPFLLHILAALFVVVFLISLAGIVQLLQSWNWILSSGYNPHPVYVVFKNAFIALASLATAAGLWARLSFSPRFSQVLAVLILAWFWLDRLILTRNPQPFGSHIFPLVLSILLLGFVWICAWLLEPFMRGQPAMTGSIEEETPDEP